MNIDTIKNNGGIIMIDFKNGSYLKLKPVPTESLRKDVEVFLIDGEELLGSFQALRDKVVLTTKRIIVINVQGLTGKKVDYTSLPYSKVQVFSVETAGWVDLDCEIDLWFSGLGNVRLEIVGNFDIVRFNKILSSQILG